MRDFLPLSRRTLLLAGGALMFGPGPLGAAGTVPTLTATRRTIDVGGRAAEVYGLRNDRGGQGLILDPGERFRLRLTNDLPEDTLIHWHGQTPPHAQDGVPGVTAPALSPGGTADYDFQPRAGTHWMHAHVPLQEMRLLAAPLIVRTPEDGAADRQEVVMMLHDFSFAPPEEVLAQLGVAGGGMDHSMHGMGGMDMSDMAMGSGGMAHDMAGMESMAMDLNDIDFDAYLTNDRTLDDPEVVTVGKGGRVLLRIINGSAATAYMIDTGALVGRVVAVDGTAVAPVPAAGFGLGMGQRLDIDLTLPAEGGAFPVLARREGAREQTGLILATAGARVARVPLIAETPAPALDRDLAQERALSAADPLAAREAIRRYRLLLGGAMQPYRWTIDGRTWADREPLEARSGERVEITFANASHMAHPMHLHGHVFQVVAIGGRRLNGARRDTVWVPPMAEVTVALDAGEAGRWMLHCHHMPHLQTGMATELSIDA